ncbi:sucrose synthase 7-like protein, partial [Tanacetum coccineum]
GLEKGLGDNVERVTDRVGFLLEVLQAPDPVNLEKFVSRLPSIFNVVLFLIHGNFGQSNILGLPDTDGQVVYVLDQVVALEEELLLRIK